MTRKAQAQATAVETTLEEQVTLNLAIEAAEAAHDEHDQQVSEAGQASTSESWTDDRLALPDLDDKSPREVSAAVSAYAARIRKRTFDVLFEHLRETAAVVPEGMTPGDVARGINMECLRVATEMAKRTYLANGYHKCVAPLCDALAGPKYAACPKHGIRFSR